ncbi:MAG: hypothetical protein DRQ10_02685 [Candidatus Hydrothermota bacterium]|nr:MAG: hypothetical protein DRQ10_02685 [Candidatus Hydrothermae bacterium]
MIVGAFVAVVTKDLLVAIVASAVVDLVLAIMFYILRAPDVAITQATIGAGLTIAIFLIALRKTERYEE